MNICFVAPFGLRPKGTVLARMVPLAAALQARGHHLSIVAPPYTNPEDSGRVEMVQGIELRNIVLPPGGKVLATPVMTWRMLRAVQEIEPELIHLFKPKGYGGLAAMLHIALARWHTCNAPLCVDSDDWEGSGGMNELHSYGSVEKRLYAFQEKWLSKRACGVSVASRALQQLTTEQLGVQPQRILYLPNGVQSRPEGNGRRIRELLGVTENQPVVLLYTRFFEFAQAPLHQLLQDLVKALPELKILVVGQGSQGQHELLLKAAHERGFSHAVHSAGWVEPDTIPDWIAAAQVAIYPFDNTLTNRTKCPAKLTELMLAGLPVVAHAVGQVQEYLDVAGQELLCRPGDWNSMRDKVLVLLQDRSRAAELGRQLREDVVKRYSWTDAATRLEQFYDDVCRYQGTV